MAQIGAAIGREFSHELIAAVASLSPVELDASLERLTSSGLISRRGTPPDATYSFKHALVQDAAYATLLKSRRQQLHASIARVLVERFPTLVEGLPELVAHHFAEAGLRSEAVGYWRRAGQLASQRSANREAARFFDQALGILDSLPFGPSELEQGFDIRLELRPALVQLGEIRLCLERLREAGRLSEKLQDDQRQARVYSFMTNVQSLLGELDEALVTGTCALDIAERLGDLRLRIVTTTYLEQAHYYMGDYERVIELASRNLKALPPEWDRDFLGASAPVSVYDRFWRVTSLAQLGRFSEAGEHEAKAIELAEATAHAFTIALAHFATSTLHLLKGDWAKARSVLEPEVQASRKASVLITLPFEIATSAWVLAQLGETSEALIRVREGEHLLKAHATRGVRRPKRMGVPCSRPRLSIARQK